MIDSQPGLEANEFRCADCGYGIVAHSARPICPMCQVSAWQRVAPGTETLAEPVTSGFDLPLARGPHPPT